MNILMIYPKPDKFKKPRFGFSYDMMMISTILEKHHTVHIKDFSCEPFDLCDFLQYIHREDIDIALVECDSYALKRSQNILHAVELIDMLNPYVTTIAYGNYCYITKRNFGNANHTITENEIRNIIDCVNQFEDHNIVPCIKSYDELPYINRDLLLGIPYYQEYKKNTLLQTSKGCENTCIFCQRKGWQCSYVAHSDDYVLAEISDIKGRGYQNIWITDENFTFDLCRSKRLLKKILHMNLHETLQFFISSWVNIDEEFLDLAKKSNVRIISFGIESGNEKILQFYRKNINIGKVPSIIQYANSIGIFTVGNFIIGAPMETEETVSETFDLIRKCEFDQINIKNLDYMIGSALHTSLDDELKVADHIFACFENGLTSFKLNDIKTRKDAFLLEYYKSHRSVIEKKIERYGTPF
ncbi:radical SAM protein [Bengtsoniella intestinalis]|uniref:B12-binding domain-containing radical SAM protein n=1 Tax=Bengtsoniella intestinalis TaxID=3073143 RepID=UPI00391FB486